MNRMILYLTLFAAAIRAQTVAIAPSDPIEIYRNEMEQVLSPENREFGISGLLNINQQPQRLFRYAAEPRGSLPRRSSGRL